MVVGKERVKYNVKCGAERNREIELRGRGCCEAVDHQNTDVILFKNLDTPVSDLLSV